MATSKAKTFTRYKLRPGHVKMLNDIDQGRTHAHGVMASQLKRCGLLKGRESHSSFSLRGCCELLPKGQAALEQAKEEGWQ